MKMRTGQKGWVWFCSVIFGPNEPTWLSSEKWRCHFFLKKPLKVLGLPLDPDVYTELVTRSEETKTFGGHTIFCLQHKSCYMKSKHTERPRIHKAKEELVSHWSLRDKEPLHGTNNALCIFYSSSTYDRYCIHSLSAADLRQVWKTW